MLELQIIIAVVMSLCFPPWRIITLIYFYKLICTEHVFLIFLECHARTNYEEFLIKFSSYIFTKIKIQYIIYMYTQHN